jgi:hypothetical protein
MTHKKMAMVRSNKNTNNLPALPWKPSLGLPMSPTRAYLRILCRGRAKECFLRTVGTKENRGFSWGFHADLMGFNGI